MPRAKSTGRKLEQKKKTRQIVEKSRLKKVNQDGTKVYETKSRGFSSLVARDRYPLKVIKISNGEKADELRNKILNLANEYSEFLTGYELVGVIDVVREDCHQSIQAMDEE